MNINDAIVGVVGTAINDGLAIHYGKTSTESLNDAERRWLIENGATPAAVNDMWFELLRATGFTGTINDMLLGFWIAGGQFGPAVKNAIVADGAPTIIVIEFNGTVSVTDAALDWTYELNGGGALIPVGGSSNLNIVELGTQDPVVYGDVLTISYSNASSDLTIDGDEFEAIADRRVTNRVAYTGAEFNPPDGVVGTAYSSYTNVEDLTGPYSLPNDGVVLPNSLSFNTTTGEISGTPSMAGTFSFIYIIGSDGETAVAEIVITEPAGSPVAVVDAYIVTDGTDKVVAAVDGVLANDTYT